VAKRTQDPRQILDGSGRIEEMKYEAKQRGEKETADDVLETQNTAAGEERR
jgi:hypothetical protein